MEMGSEHDGGMRGHLALVHTLVTSLGVGQSELPVVGGGEGGGEPVVGAVHLHPHGQQVQL